MLETILANEKFKKMMVRNIKECLELMLEEKTGFSIMANLSMVKFDPLLPKEISSTFKLPVIVFELANYTLESAKLTDSALIFEAGFSEENYASTLTIPFCGIVQIILEQSPIMVNFAIYQDLAEDEKRTKSKNIFSNSN